MPLDLSQVAAQIEGLAAKLRADEKERANHLERALQRLRLLQQQGQRPVEQMAAPLRIATATQ